MMESCIYLDSLRDEPVEDVPPLPGEADVAADIGQHGEAESAISSRPRCSR
jgi:hypothetical protein